MTAVAAVLFALSTVNLAHASPHHPTICEKAYTLRQIIQHRYSPQWVAGRNICRFGIPTPERPRGTARKSTTLERARYLHAMQALAAPAPYLLSIRPGAPKVGPAGTLTVHYQPEGLARCIAYAESGNGADQSPGAAHTGIAQWSPEAWARMGGLRFAAVPVGASYDEQMLVLSFGLVHYGCSDWCPFDPC